MAGPSNPVYAYGKDVEFFVGTVTGNGSGNATITTGKSSLASCAITATGKYTLTLKDRGRTLLGVHFTMQGATGASDCKLARPITINSTAKTITLEVHDMSNSATLINAANTDIIHVCVVYSRQ